MNRKEIRKWMIDAELTSVQLAKELGVTSQLVTMMLAGKRKRQAAKLAELLLKHGCPAEHLGGTVGDQDRAA